MRYPSVMSNVFSIAASGMAAAQTRLEVSARNVAGAAVTAPADGDVAAAFAALRADQVALAGGGTRVTVSAPLGGEVDLANEAVQQMIARYTFAANAKVMRAAAQMQKSLLDVKA
jgi:flagellar basal-body rod protein FlgC